MQAGWKNLGCASGPEVGTAVSILKAADWKGDAVISSGVL